VLTLLSTFNPEQNIEFLGDLPNLIPPGVIAPIEELTAGKRSSHVPNFSSPYDLQWLHSPLAAESPGREGDSR